MNNNIFALLNNTQLHKYQIENYTSLDDYKAYFT